MENENLGNTNTASEPVAKQYRREEVLKYLRLATEKIARSLGYDDEQIKKLKLDEITSAGIFYHFIRQVDEHLTKQRKLRSVIEPFEDSRG